MNVLLRAEKLVAGWHQPATQPLDLSIAAGEIVGLTGPNGVFRQLPQARQAFEDAAREASSAGALFTTHTPVPAGNETYSADEILPVLGRLAAAVGISDEEFLGLGRVHPGDGSEPSGMTTLAIRSARSVNGVSRRHGEVARAMWQPMFDDRSVDDVPITSVTNGVHAPSWICPPMRTLLDRHLGTDWPSRAADPRTWEPVTRIPDDELWAQVHPTLGSRASQIGDSVAPRTVAEAVLEGRRVALELGGKNPNIVFADADLDNAVSWAVEAIFRNAGQICLAGSRLFVHSSIYDDFLRRFVAAAEQLTIGDPFDPATRFSALASKRHFDKVVSYVEGARELGGNFHTGGVADEVRPVVVELVSRIVASRERRCGRAVSRDDLLGAQYRLGHAGFAGLRERCEFGLQVADPPGLLRVGRQCLRHQRRRPVANDEVVADDRGHLNRRAVHGVHECGSEYRQLAIDG